MGKDRIPTLIAEIRERLDELETLTMGEVPDVVKMGKRAHDTWTRLWEAKYREPYVANHKVEKPNIKRFLTKGVSVEILEEKMAAYLLDSDPFLVRQRHPFNLFVSRFNSIRVREGAADAPAPPVDCHHTPTCKSDIEHTRRMMGRS